MDSIVKQLKQFKADAIYEKKKHYNAAERKRRITRSLSFAGIAVAACYLAWQAIIMIHAYVQPFSPENASASVIGGADGPTSIFVYNSGISVTGMITIAVILIVSICGICLTRRK